MKNVFENLKIHKLNLTNYEKEGFKLLENSKYVSSNNDRICRFNKFDVLFDPTKNISEYYSKYIGVTIDGNIYHHLIHPNGFYS